jgi:hypothetical protein
LILGITMLTGSLRASMVAAGSGAALGGNDNVYWSQLGSAGAILANTNSFTSSGGIGGSIKDNSGAPQLRDNATYHLNNSPVYENQYAGPVTINFNTAVLGVGVLMMNDFGSAPAFSYHIQAFSAGASLGTFDFASPGVAGTPTYVGVLDTLPEITKVIITTDAFGANSGNYFALDTLNLKDPAVTASTPEPASFALAAVGIVVVAIGLRRRQPRAPRY